jgi:predicted enzyme related to lactoylglutathione lyase
VTVNVSLNRIILSVRDVETLAAFYRDAFGLSLVEEIEGEWAVLDAPFRDSDASTPGSDSNSKIVLCVSADLEAFRDDLLARGVAMRAIKSYPGFSGPLCDGSDPEGNVFQLAQI